MHDFPAPVYMRSLVSRMTKARTPINAAPYSDAEGVANSGRLSVYWPASILSPMHDFTQVDEEKLP